MSLELVSILLCTIASNFFMYRGWVPSFEVSAVDTFDARMLHRATAMRFMFTSSNVQSEFSTSFAHRNRSNVTS